MQNLQSTKNRIKLVSSIKKITYAMEMISIAKMRKSLNIYNNAKAYNEELIQMFAKISMNMSQEDFDHLLHINNSKNSLYILITSDLGMAGAYNANVCKLLNNELKEGDKIIIFGIKGISFVNDKKWNNHVIATYMGSSDKAELEIVRNITKEFTNLFKNNKVGSLKIIHTSFINNLVQHEMIKNIFPIEVKEIAKKGNKYHAIVDFEPSPAKVLKNAMPLYIKNAIYTSYIESKLCENASRRIAMDNATQNASEIIDKLKLEYNQKRQAKITQELIEIISGANLD